MPWRKPLALLLAAAGCAAIWFACVVPYRCSRVEAIVSSATEPLLDAPDTYRRRRAAERNLALLRDCLDRDANVNLLMLAAANEHMLDHATYARELYARALQLDRRPELYLDLGLMQLDTRDTAGAIESFVAAGKFAGKDYLLDIPDATARMRAYEIVARHEIALAERGYRADLNLVRNARFDEAGARGARTSDTGSGVPWQSAAAGWTAVASSPATVTTELVPSERRGGGKMLHVVAGAQQSGVYQVWSESGPRSDNVVASAWIFVRSGRVGIGSGNVARTNLDAFTVATGRWERLQAPNGHCPANELAILSASETADFYVDEVFVREVPGGPCSE